jgi:DNA-binding transcriptional LysR family regulator
MAGRNVPFDWNDIPILVALARNGSMRTAGRHLGVDTSTISRRLAAAEKALQTRLFIRGPDGYKPTDAGRAFLGPAQTIEDSVHALVSATAQEAQSVSGPVRITSVDVVLIDWLISRLPELRALYPELEVRVIADNQVLSFTRSEADLAMRVARPREDAAILMRRIASVGMAVYGAATFKRVPRSRWSELPWLGFNEDLADATEMKWLSKNVPAAKPQFRCSSMSGLMRACEAGLGLALLPCFAVESRNLVRLSASPEFQRDLYLLSHRQAGKIRRFRAIAEWITATAERDAAILSGA